MLTGWSLLKRIGWRSMKRTGLRSLKRTDSNLQMPIGLSLQRQIHSHLPMLTGSHSLMRIRLCLRKLIG